MKKILITFLLITLSWLPFALGVGSYIADSVFEMYLALLFLLIPLIFMLVIGIVWKNNFLQVTIATTMASFILIIVTLKNNPEGTTFLENLFGFLLIIGVLILFFIMGKLTKFLMNKVRRKVG